MDPIEIYKKLPGNNCGKCRQKACMPFAFALAKGDATASDCPGLTEKDRGELETQRPKADWREDMIAGLKEEIKKIRFDAISHKLGADLKDGRLSMRCFGRNITIDGDGEMQTGGRLTPWMRMLVLFYIRNGGGQGLTGKWVLHSELMGGLMKYKAFKRECEEPLKELLDRHFDQVGLLIEGYGAVHPEGFSTQHAWLVNVFPMLPVLFLYWPADDEFESQITIRFDSSADRYFDVEQLIFLLEEIVKDVEVSLSDFGPAQPIN